MGDPGIEPGAGFPGGVTVHCRTLQRVAHLSAVITGPPLGRQVENRARRIWGADGLGGCFALAVRAVGQHGWCPKRNVGYYAQR